MAPIAAFAAIAFILADALVRRQTRVTAAAAGALAIAALLALAASLAAGLGRQVRLVIVTGRHATDGSDRRLP